MTKRVAIGMAGAGWPAWQQIEGFKKVEDVEVTALCDIDEERLERIAGEYGIPNRYVSYDEMLKKESLDAVSVCTPNYLHGAMSVKALEQGLHVLCEKPMADTSRAAKVMLDASRASGKVLMIAHLYRCNPSVKYLKELIEKGDLGEIYFVRAWWKRRSGIPGMGGWFTQKEKSGGGALIDIGVHILDLALWLIDFPEVTGVSGSWGDRFAHRGKGLWDYGTMANGAEGKCNVEDFAVGHVTFDQGRSLFLQCSWASHIKGYDDGLEVWGEKGGAKLKIEENLFEVYTDDGNVPLDIMPRPPTANLFDEETRHFIDCIRNGRAPLCPPEEGMKTMEVIEKIYQSGEKG